MPSSLKSTECPSFLIRCGLSTYSSLLLNSLSKLVPPGFCDSSLLVTHLSPVSVASSSSIVVRCSSSSILDLSSSLYTPCSSDLIFHSFGYHQCLEIPISSPEFSLGSTWISRSSLPIWRLCRHLGLKPQTELILSALDPFLLFLQCPPSWSRAPPSINRSCAKFETYS